MKNDVQFFLELFEVWGQMFYQDESIVESSFWIIFRLIVWHSNRGSNAESKREEHERRRKTPAACRDKMLEPLLAGDFCKSVENNIDNIV